MVGAIAVVFTAIVGLITGFVSSELKQLADRRDQLARNLAEYYASAARVYYAWHDFDDCEEDSPKWQYLHTEYWKYYELFLRSSTAVFALCPNDEGTKVLDLEELWTDIVYNPPEDPEKKWFDALDGVRDELLPLIRSRFLNPGRGGALVSVAAKRLNR